MIILNVNDLQMLKSYGKARTKAEDYLVAISMLLMKFEVSANFQVIWILRNYFNFQDTVKNELK